jgi:ABC-type proline/glycine betaine transport system permease subunit
MMDKYLDMINVKIDVVFSFIEKVSMFCFDKLSDLLELAYSWVVAIAIVLLLIMAIGLSF